MTRSTIHRLFAAASVCALASVLWHAWHYWQYKNTVAAVSSVPAVLSESDLQTGAVEPSVALAQANALAAGGHFEAAESRYVRLIDSVAENSVSQIARFNLANLYLREGVREELPGNTTRALLEIAKQRYRDLLHADPDNWDARYNLELALRASPERERDDGNKGPPPKRVRVIVPDFEADNLP